MANSASQPRHLSRRSNRSWNIGPRPRRPQTCPHRPHRASCAQGRCPRLRVSDCHPRPSIFSVSSRRRIVTAGSSRPRLSRRSTMTVRTRRDQAAVNTAALLVVGAGAGRLLDVDQVALRRTRLRGYSPASADPPDLSDAGELTSALLSCVHRRDHKLNMVIISLTVKCNVIDERLFMAILGPWELGQDRAGRSRAWAARP